LLGKAEEYYENMCIAGLKSRFDLGTSSKGCRSATHSTETFRELRSVALECQVKLSRTLT